MSNRINDLLVIYYNYSGDIFGLKFYHKTELNTENIPIEVKHIILSAKIRMIHQTFDYLCEISDY